jgi:hypothetical protein
LSNPPNLKEFVRPSNLFSIWPKKHLTTNYRRGVQCAFITSTGRYFDYLHALSGSRRPAYVRPNSFKMSAIPSHPTAFSRCRAKAAAAGSPTPWIGSPWRDEGANVLTQIPHCTSDLYWYVLDQTGLCVNEREVVREIGSKLYEQALDE